MNKKILSIIAFALFLFVVGTIFVRPHKAHAPEIIPPKNIAIDTFVTHDRTTSDGTITFGYSSSTFGLAASGEQVPVHSYIPPCASNFTYCLYFHSDIYKGTNFESAGLRVQKRNDLMTLRACTDTPPEGHTEFTPRIKKSSQYTTSTFLPLGDGAAGHYASGALYRLSYNNVCYEFETRIGMSQYANYPEGTIKKFTDEDQKEVNSQLLNVLESITLPRGEKVLFPT